jgi:flagellar biosynthesis/type III secretory pathway protein FliH
MAPDINIRENAHYQLGQEEGLQKGLQLGHEEGKEQAALNMLREGFAPRR